MTVKFKALPETWPLSKYEVSIDGKIIGVVGQYQYTAMTRSNNRASLSQKVLWYAGVEGGWSKRSLGSRKAAVEALKKKTET